MADSSVAAEETKNPYIEESAEKAQEEDPTAGMSAKQKKLFKLRMRMNQARKANAKEVEAEKKRFVGGKRRKDTNEWKERSDDWKEELKNEGVDKEKGYLLETAEDHQEKERKKKQKAKHHASFGWEVFNQDTIAKAHEKRYKELPTSHSDATATEHIRTGYSNADYGTNDKVTDAGLDRMVAELKKRDERRDKFSRRRDIDDQDSVDYINHRNQHFNKKIARAFDKYTVEIRQNLERGTAM